MEDIIPIIPTMQKLVTRTVRYMPAVATPKGVSTSEDILVDLVFISGIAIFNYQGTGAAWRRDRLVIDTATTWGHLNSPSAGVNVRPQAVASASLASVSNDHEAVDAGWATDDCVPYFNPDTGRLFLYVPIAVRDVDGLLQRVSFEAKVVGILVELRA